MFTLSSNSWPSGTCLVDEHDTSAAINDNVVYHNGRVVAQHLKQSELIEKIKELP